MSATDRIRDQLARSMHGGAWHGPALLELLDGLEWRGAVARPVPGAHSIAELVLHVATWMGVVRERMGGQWSQVSDERDFPPPPTDDAAWLAAVETLRREAEALDRALENLSDDTLSLSPPGGQVSLERMLDGVVQHNLYHAGQIAILKKGLTADPPGSP